MIAASAGAGFLHRGRPRRAGAAPGRLRLALATARAFRDVAARRGEWLHLPRAPAARRAQGAGARVHRGRMSPVFRTNGTTEPRRSPTTSAMPTTASPTGGCRSTAWSSARSLSLAELRAMPARTQITRHDCVEGWSAIGKWTGVPLGARCSTRPGCSRRRATSSSTAPTDEGSRHAPTTRASTSIDAFHPQTILAYEHERRGAARSATARRCGCASSASSATSTAKYVMRIEVVKLRPIGGGKGGYWEDRGYDWYAGI